MLQSDFAQATLLSPTMVARWYEAVERAMMEFAIVSPRRAAAFIGQVGHESGGFQFTRELWGPTSAQRRYDVRADLGNTKVEAIRIAGEHGAGPGFWWRGAGLIQVTGYDNNKVAGEALGLDLLNCPELLEAPVSAARSAGWWWAAHGLNELADVDDFDGISDVINRGRKTAAYGDSNGFADRKVRWEIAKAGLGV